VGHYFMCHPFSGWSPPMISTEGSYLWPDQSNFMQGNYCKRNEGATCVEWAKWSDTSDKSPGNTVEGRFITNPQTTKARGIGRCWFWAEGNSPMYFEMAPNYDSCVTIDPNHCDPVFCQPLTKINWVLTDTDKRTYEENCEEFQRNVGGAMSYPSWKEMSTKWVPNGHHMGTTRMSVKPEEGVVDQNLQVHGVSNLYVAGSSVFPSGGISNPTFTIVALSLRLACHVRERLGKPKCEPPEVLSAGGAGD